MSNKRRRKTTPTKASAKPRRASVQQQQVTERPWTRWILIGVSVLVIGGLSALIVLNQPEELDPPDGVVRTIIADRDHVNGAVAYAQDPPAGGNHAPVWQECGFYASPINSENAVHSLEHGAVWITYDPDLDDDSIDTLADYARDQLVLVSPYPGLDVPVVATTWGNQIRLTGADDPDLEAFVVNFKSGPDTPERGASCNDGRGNTAFRGQASDGEAVEHEG